jgi:hypothetical protein
MRQGAMAGLIDAGERLRAGGGDAGAEALLRVVSGDPGAPGRDAGAMQRLRGSLNRDESENIELITHRLIESQEAAAPRWAQPAVQLPRHGRVVRFSRAVQVKPNAPMAVRFEAAPRSEAAGGWLIAAALFVAITLAVGVVGFCAKRWGRVRDALGPGAVRIEQRTLVGEATSESDDIHA